MRHSLVTGSIALVVLLVPGLLLSGQRAAAQGLPPLEPIPGVEEPDAAMLRQVVTGRVCMPDGSPAAGAVIVTSAGGQAVTSADGSFMLEVNVPFDVESLEVTAVADEQTGSGSLVASARLVPAALSPSAGVGRLALTLAPSCAPRWLPTFGTQPGTNNGVQALAVFDDGSGPALYAGGSFTTAGGVAASRIAKWDGSTWVALGLGIVPGVQALASWDDGDGQALYAGGLFTASPAGDSYLAKWGCRPKPSVKKRKL